MQTCQIVPPPSVDESIRGIVAELVNSSPRPQRALLALTGLSKDQLCRMQSGARSLPVPTALAILEAADYPARGALALALFRPDLAVEQAAGSFHCPLPFLQMDTAKSNHSSSSGSACLIGRD